MKHLKHYFYDDIRNRKKIEKITHTLLLNQYIRFFTQLIYGLFFLFNFSIDTVIFFSFIVKNVVHEHKHYILLIY